MAGVITLATWIRSHRPYFLKFVAGVIRAGVNGAGVKKGSAEKGPIRYSYNLTNILWNAVYRIR